MPPDNEQSLQYILEFARKEQADDPYAFDLEASDYAIREQGGRYETARFPWDEAVLADLVLVAQGLCMIGRPEIVVIPPLVRLPAFRKLFGEGCTPERVRELLGEAEAEVAEVKALLST